MVMEWEREGNVIAERFKKEEIPGFLTKEFLAKDNEYVVVEKGREIYRERGPGKFSISGFAGDLTNILLIDKSEKTYEGVIKNVWLPGNKKIDIEMDIKFRVFHSDHFSKRLMGERGKMFLDDIWNETLSEVMCKRILPELQKNQAKEFLKEDFIKKTKENIEVQIENRFKGWGLMLTSLSVDFKLPEKIEEEKEEVVIEEKSETEKETEERGAEIELESKHAQKDMEEAMKAMASEDVKEHEEELEKELEELKRAKEIAEKKFYKKELSEEAFQRMMEEFERKIIEIETKLKEK